MSGDDGVNKVELDGIEWTYVVKDGFAVVGDGSSPAIPRTTSGKIAIPSTLGGCPVTKIGDGAFRYCKITSVAIPRNVVSIGDCAFEFCERLMSLRLSDGLTRIGKNAFYCCNGLADVTIPDSVTIIGDGAFCKCEKLVNVAIPRGVASIGSRAFAECTRLKNVKIPDGVLSIGDGAFSGCDKLQSVVMPASAKNIGQDVFAYCPGLKSMKIAGCETSAEAVAWQKWAREVFASNKLSSDFCKVTTEEKAVGKIDVVAQFGTVADENALPSFMRSVPAKVSVWEQAVHAISLECLALLPQDGLKEDDRRENVSLMLQAAFAIVPEEWQIMNECDAAQYFFMFCGCLGIHSLTSSNARVEFVQGGWRSSYFLFDFTYGKSTSDALRACESRRFPRTEIPDQVRLLFGVNYNLDKRNIDKPLTACFRNECTRHVPNYAASDAFCSEFAWSLTSRDKCGRGDDVVPKDAQDVALWLRQRRKSKEQKEERRSGGCEEMRASCAEDEQTPNGTECESESERLERTRRANIEAFRDREKYRTREAIFGTEGQDPPFFIKAMFYAVLILVFFLIKSCVQ